MRSSGRSLLMLLVQQAPAAQAKAIEVPATFVADRVYVTLQTAAGRPITLYSDSGGGSLIITRAAAGRLGLPMQPIADPEAKAELGNDAAITAPPALGRGFPQLPARAFAVVHSSQLPGWPDQADGFVGAKWFGRGTWTWDYASGRLWYRPSASLACGQGALLGFKTEKGGERPTNFARIAVEVDGRSLPMLLDTGAETLLTPAAVSGIGDRGPAFRATSMLEASEFDSLRKTHPDWPFVDKAQVGSNAPMLRVPFVTIGKTRTGPVWFTRRSDAAYKTFMSSMMDQPVVGSIGGNAFHGLVLTVDFRRARAWVGRPGAACPGDRIANGNDPVRGGSNADETPIAASSMP